MALIILAGGKSTRMGNQDKALLPLGDDIMVGVIIKKLQFIFREIFIVAKEAEPFLKYPVKVIFDEYPGCGPISGIHAGLKASSEQHNLILACDMPLIKVELINLLLKRTPTDLVIPQIGEYLEPLVAIYAKKILPLLEKFILDGDFKLTHLFPYMEVDYVLETELRKVDPELESFTNINSPDEYYKIKKKILELEAKQ